MAFGWFAKKIKSLCDTSVATTKIRKALPPTLQQQGKILIG